MNEGLTEAIEGLVKFTNDYMAKAQAELKRATDKIEAGTYNINDAFDGMMRAATLWVSAVAGTAVESMDFATTLTKFVGTRTITTKPFTVGHAGAWTLAITQPFTNAQKTTLDAGSVSVEPGEVADGLKDPVIVRAVLKSAESGYYGGVVTATNKDGSGTTQALPVQIQVS